MCVKSLPEMVCGGLGEVVGKLKIEKGTLT